MKDYERLAIERQRTVRFALFLGWLVFVAIGGGVVYCAIRFLPMLDPARFARAGFAGSMLAAILFGLIAFGSWACNKLDVALRYAFAMVVAAALAAFIWTP